MLGDEPIKFEHLAKLTSGTARPTWASASRAQTPSATLAIVRPWCRGQWNGRPLEEKPPFYQGVEEFTQDVLLKLTDEAQAVRNKMEI